MPSTIAVEAGHKVSLIGHAEGVQKYTCNTVAGGGYVWGPGSTPQANLYDDHGKLIMTHFGGPSWQAKDGSTVVAARVDGVPVAGTIQWLLLKVTSATDGPDGGDRLSGTKFIQRINTTGGVAPAAGTATRRPSARSRRSRTPPTTSSGRSRARSPSKKSPARHFFDGLLARPAARCAANRPDLPPTRGREHDAQA